MKLIDLKCPNCGSILQVNPEQKEAYCQYCGAKLAVDDEVQHIQYDNAEQAGYEFEKGRQRAQAEQQYNYNTIPQQPYQQTYTQPQKKKHTWLWVLGWIFFFPIPLTVLIARSPKLNTKVKAILIAVLWVVILIIGFTGNSDTNTNSESNVNNTSVSETIEQVDEVETDFDIINRANHPTYYGSVEESHKIWDDVEKGKIHFGDKNYGNNDNPILSMSSYRNSDLIRGISFNFNNFNDHKQFSLDEVLPIAASYMPFEIMDKYYEFRRSELIAPDKDKKDGNMFYVITYGLTDDGSKAYYSKEHEYSGSIDIIIEVNNDIVQNMDIVFGTPRWMSSLGVNGYHSENWDCNLYDYR